MPGGIHAPNILRTKNGINHANDTFKNLHRISGPGTKTSRVAATVGGVQELTPDHVEKIFRTNIFGFFYMTKAVFPHLHEGAAIINTTSIQAYEPSPHLMDYACTKAAILNFTRSLAKELAEKKIRVNAVAPGPIWTPLIPASFEGEDIKTFGQKTLFKRAGQPAELAPAYVFFASEMDSSFITGQVLHVNGGQGMFS